MFFATFFSTASLGALIQKTTNKRIGLEEYLLMNAIAGMTHALFGCQVLPPHGCAPFCLAPDSAHATRVS
jgi:hypothetical protein